MSHFEIGKPWVPYLIAKVPYKAASVIIILMWWANLIHLARMMEVPTFCCLKTRPTQQLFKSIKAFEQQAFQPIYHSVRSRVKNYFCFIFNNFFNEWMCNEYFCLKTRPTQQLFKSIKTFKQQVFQPIYHSVQRRVKKISMRYLFDI